ncbi:MAG: DNA polymerase III subunit alpha [Enterococcus sp.]|nr:DNA polymerase III subunit alpha [Enterococcus sp.]
MSNQFVHLHTHSDHSVLDGHANYKDLANEVQELGQPGFSITDHGRMSNVYNGWKAAKERGLKFLPGVEAYVTPGDTPMETWEPVFFGNDARENKEERSNDVSGGGAYTHMTMLAETTEGMHNLFKLNTLSWQKGNYRKNRIDVATISTMSQGIIATTGCPSGELQTRLRLGQWDEAMKYASKMQDIFGKENYFLELMDHNMSIDLERKVRGDLLKVAKELNIPLLATNDLHYVRREDAPDHEHMLALQSGSSMNELPYDKGGKRFAFEGEEYYVKSAEEMYALFPEADFPGAISNTVAIAERASAEFKYDPNLRPSVPLPSGHTEDSFLRQEAFEGLARKRPDKVNDPEYIERLEKELAVFKEKNFSGYMLVVSDFIRWAKAQKWQVGPARGSGGGSLLAFCTDITEIDPIPHGLIFERFLNPERDSPPDIDSDFDDINREKVIDYVRQKYGEETVAMIITFGMIKAKSALKDISRIFEEPFITGETLTKAIPPPVSGKEMTLSQIFDKNDKRYIEAGEFRKIANEGNNRKIIDAALGIEGKMRSTGVHAAGVIMGSKALVDSIPLMMRKEDGVMITQFDYPTCEDLGLIKMDFLGIRNLTVIDKAIKAIERNHGVKLNSFEIYDSVLNTYDEKTYKLLQDGHTLGVFQLDSPPIAALLRAIVPNKFGDLSATIALYRPGPMGMNSHNEYADRKNGRKPVVPIHPELEEPLKDIVEETYGVICYQEQVMAIAQKLAGYSMGQADNLRRAMGKKKKSVLDAEFPMFEAGMKANGYSSDAIEIIWNTLIPFAEYGFNKSHSAGYGLISYITAYLKAHYPAEFMAANLSTLTKDKDKTALYLEECRRLGLKVSSPSVSYSTADYTAVNGNEILVGLQALRGVGEAVADAISHEAIENGPFTSLDDFMNRAPSHALSKGVLESLSLSGALDNYGYSRRTLYLNLPEAAKGFAQVKKKQDNGQFSLFDEMEESETIGVDIPQLPEYPKKEKLAKERHYIGLYVSDHPLSGIAHTLSKHADTKILDILTGEVRPQGGFGDRKRITIAGVANSVVKKPTKKGAMFAMFSLEDVTGSIPCLMFPKTFETFGDKLATDNIYKIQGSLLQRDGEEEVSFSVDRIEEIEVTDDGRLPYTITVNQDQVSNESMEELGRILDGHKGDMPVFVNVNTPKGLEVYRLGDNRNVNNNPLLHREVMMLFGTGSL